MMTEEKIARINELAKKAKSPEGLTAGESLERDRLRREYVESVKASLTAHLENVRIVEPDGTVLDRRDQHLLALSDDRYAFITMRVASYSSDALGTIRYSVDYDSLRYGLMDTAGREILPAEYLEIRSAGTDRYFTIAEDGLRLSDEEGNVLWSHLTEE